MEHSLRIVVADDEQDMRDYFGKVLRHLGHQVVGTAADGRELIELCRHCHPDLVISDIRMPHLDGLAAVATILQERPLPVILVSANSDDDSERRAEMNQWVCRLGKPVRQAHLEVAIGTALACFAARAATEALSTTGPNFASKLVTESPPSAH
jgi:response regulator NasT